MKRVLGISAHYHDSAAALVIGDQIVAAAQEERFTRKKHDEGFPKHAIEFCLKQAGIKLGDLDAITFYDKPLTKFERLLETYVAFAPQGLRSYLMAMPVWLKEKLFLKTALKKELSTLSGVHKRDLPRLLFAEHHQSHAASAFFPSPFEKAAVLCMDGVGEWATTSLWLGEGSTLKPLWEIQFPHSLGLLYSAFTYYTGFKVNSGEYKLMGLAPYGEPVYEKLITDHLIDVKPDGTFRLNMDYFDFATGLKMTSRKFHKLFGGSPRKPESPITQREMDLARSVQKVTEEIVLKLVRTAMAETGCQNVCLAGGVALNCVANGRVVRESGVQGLWIQPAAGDAGGALGAALATAHQYFGVARSRTNGSVTTTSTAADDTMQGSFLGPQFSNEEVQSRLDKLGARYERLSDDAVLDSTVKALSDEAVVGWFQGRMEFGPRALGGRSILGDPRSTKMQSVMNLKIKYRESFRPFAPSIPRENVSEFFEMDGDSPYMLLVAPVQSSHRRAMSAEESSRFGIEKLHVPRSTIPAVTHVDYSARVQTVTEQANPRYYRLLKRFGQKTGTPVLVNTSFNVRGEPIVGSPEDAYRCFMRTEMDVLVVENFLMRKADQPSFEDTSDWRKEFALD